jgi:hypothetical protein
MAAKYPKLLSANKNPHRYCFWTHLSDCELHYKNHKLLTLSFRKYLGAKAWPQMREISRPNASFLPGQSSFGSEDPVEVPRHTPQQTVFKTPFFRGTFDSISPKSGHGDLLENPVLSASP